MVRFAPIVTAAFACAALATASFARPSPILIWNASPSIPMGLYIVERRSPTLREIAVIRPPEWVSVLANERHYLPSSAVLLKPVAVSEGDTVCRFGLYVFMNGRLRVKALRRDKMRRPLPSWMGCVRLRAGQIFVLSMRKDSFDSRYFGVVEQRGLIGVGKLIFSLD